MTTKDKVIFTHKLHPTWNSVQIAAHLGCMPEYVRATASRNRLRLPARVHKSEILDLGRACVAAGLTLSDIERLTKEKANG